MLTVVLLDLDIELYATTWPTEPCGIFPCASLIAVAQKGLPLTLESRRRTDIPLPVFDDKPTTESSAVARIQRPKSVADLIVPTELDKFSRQYGPVFASVADVLSRFTLDVVAIVSSFLVGCVVTPKAEPFRIMWLPDSRLGRGCHMTMDRYSNVYLTDHEGSIHIFNENGVRIGQSQVPSNRIVIHRSGEMFILETDLKTVHVHHIDDPSKNLRTFSAASVTAHMLLVGDEVLMVDFWRSKSAFYSQNGGFLRETSIFANPEIEMASQMAANEQGDIFVTTRTPGLPPVMVTCCFSLVSYSDQVFNKEGTDIGNFGSFFRTVEGIGFDCVGNVYLLDRFENRVQIYNPDGVFLTAFDTHSSHSVHSICIGNSGFCYVFYSHNNNIEVFGFAGRV